MTRWITDKIGNEIVVLSNGGAPGLTEHDFISNSDQVIIGYHLSSGNIKILENVLHHHTGKVQFAVFQDAVSVPDPVHDETLVFYHHGQEWLSMTHSHQTNIFSTEIIDQFIDYGLLPVVEELTPSNFQQYVHSKSPIFWVWIDIDHKSVNDRIFGIFRDLMAYRRNTKLEPFGCIYSDSHRFRTHLQSLHLNESGPFPQGQMMYEERKYHYPHNQDGDFSFDSVMAFLETVMDTDHREKMEKNIRFGTRSLPSEHGHPLSAPVNAEDAVIVINTEYHDQIVYQSAMTVVVQYYARWSERCKHFASDYRKVGAAFRDDHDVLITKLNIVRNDPPFYLSDVPVIVLYFKGKGDHYVKYEGLLHAKPIIEWIREHQHREEDERRSSKLKFE